MRKDLCLFVCALFVLYAPAAVADDPRPAAAATAGGLDRAVEKIPGTLVEFEMVRLPGGSLEYTIGKTEPRQAVVKPFWIGKTEVTFDELDVFRLGLDLPEQGRDLKLVELINLKTRPSKAQGDPSWGFGTVRQPALSITYHHAAGYCKWLSEKTGRKYRLPTEVEWEYACRAGRPAERLSEKELDNVAWWRTNSITEEHIDGKTHPVGTKAPNAWGLHDMLGNAWEWCTGVDGNPVARGGAYDSPAEKVHAGARLTRFDRWFISQPQEPRSTWWFTDGKTIGFRIVRED